MSRKVMRTTALASLTLAGVLTTSVVFAKPALVAKVLNVQTILNRKGDVLVKDNLKVKGLLTMNSSLLDATAGNAITVNVTGSDTTGATTEQNGLAVKNFPSAQSVDSLFVLNNTDTDTAVDSAIRLVNAGGGFTNVIDNEGTKISGAELNVLDDGIALSELTNSGTFTAGTVAIGNTTTAGTMNNTTVGATTPAAGTFTTLTSTGTLTAATATISAGTINAASVGTTTPAGGVFTNLKATTKLTLSRQSFVMTTAGAAQENLLPTAPYIQISGQDNGGDTIALQNSSATPGDVIYLENVGNSAVAIVESTGVKLSGGSQQILNQNSIMGLIYNGTSWIQLSAVVNNQ